MCWYACDVILRYHAWVRDECWCVLCMCCDTLLLVYTVADIMLHINMFDLISPLRCIDYATLTQKRQLVQEIVNNSLELVQDAFGNYVVQYVLDLGEPPISHGIMANLLGHISSLSVQKFSSNVVEKCLELAGDKMRAKVIDELVNVER